MRCESIVVVSDTIDSRKVEVEESWRGEELKLYKTRRRDYDDDR